MSKTKTKKTDFNWNMERIRAAILQAMLPEVMFEGWSEGAFESAIRAADIDQAQAKLAFPKGAVDVAVHMHKIGDQKVVDELADRVKNVSSFSAKIEQGVVMRLQIANAHREAVHAACTLFAQPKYAVLSSKLMWGTADAIWRALGDTSSGFTFYSKRATLSAVYSSSLLYWLQDSSKGMSATSEFVHRRIENVGQFGKFTSKFKRSDA